MSQVTLPHAWPIVSPTRRSSGTPQKRGAPQLYVRAMALRSITFTALWLTLLAFCIWLGFSSAIELRFGELVLPITIAIACLLVIILALLLPAARSHCVAWCRLLAVSGVLSVLAVALVSRLTDGFSCQYSCPGILNNALGYACGEWSRGCIAEWFSLFLLGFSAVLGNFSRFRPNPSFERDAAKARRPSTLRWASIND